MDFIPCAYEVAPHRAVNTFGVALNMLIRVSINVISLHSTISVEKGRMVVSVVDLVPVSGSNIYVGLTIYFGAV